MDLCHASTPFNWACPSCNVKTTITSSNFASNAFRLDCDVTPDEKSVIVDGYLVQCPNAECDEQYVLIEAHHATTQKTGNGTRFHANRTRPVGIASVVYYPTTPVPLSSHVPKYVQKDYSEAYLIRTFSPKASATLARRALQGMIRDFWAISKPTLHAELTAIKDKCDGDLYGAMMGLKSIGNIGAHPERDVNQIVDVDPGEPEALLNLIHLLDQEWYVVRAERQRRIEQVKSIASDKRASPAPQ